MRPYEIRQMRDGSIDYNNYYARPLTLVTPQMRRLTRAAFSPKALVLLLATVAALGLLPMFATGRVPGNVARTMTTKPTAERVVPAPALAPPVHSYRG